MPTFKRADVEVTDMATELIGQYHPTLSENDVRVDYMFAFPDYDDVTGEPKGFALKLHGVQALGIAKKLGPKERAKGNFGCKRLSCDDIQQRELARVELSRMKGKFNGITAYTRK